MRSWLNRPSTAARAVLLLSPAGRCGWFEYGLTILVSHMIFTETSLAGAYRIEFERFEDARGFFARSFCREEFARHGLNPRIEQCNVSFNRERGTLRGMHYQVAPHQEDKLVRCTRGALLDVIIDLRPESPTFCGWTAVELTAGNRLMFYVPEGFAHGFQTLEDDTEVCYQMSAAYAPESAQGVRWNDPRFAIDWPINPPILSEQDLFYPDFEERELGVRRFWCSRD